MPEPESKMSTTPVSTWKPLYQIGGIAALLAVFVFRRNLGAELMAFKGFGLFTAPETLPARAAGWFALLQDNMFVGLALFEMFDLVEYVLVGLIFLSVCVALWQTNRSATVVAAFFGLVGITVYIASNQAFAMLSLSGQHAAAASDAERAAFEYAGEALLAVHNPGLLYQGTGIYTSLFLVLLAGLIFSVIMLRSNNFSKLTAVSGILANGFGLGYFIVLPFAPALLALPFVISAPFRMIWYFMIAWMLFRIAGDHDGKRDP
jgi:hypothetical protein